MTQVYTYLFTDLTTSGGVLVEHVLKQEIIDNAANIVVAPIDVRRSSVNPTTEFEVEMASSLTTSRKTALDGTIAAHTGVDNTVKEPKFSDYNHQVVEIAPKKGIGTTIYTHDWTKPETWYQESTQQTGITLVEETGTIFKIPGTKYATSIRQNSTAYNVGDVVRPSDSDYDNWHYECTVAGTTDSSEPIHYTKKENLTFDDGTVTWKAIKPVIIIDVENLKITNEKLLRSTYAPKVYVDATLKTPSSAHWRIACNQAESEGWSHTLAKAYLDGDYYVNYDGYVEFSSSQSGSSVTMDFYKSNTSGFKLSPNTGEIWRIVMAENQYSSNVRLRDNNIAQFRAYNGAVVLKEVNYEGIKTFLDDVSKAYPIFPKTPISGELVANPRDLPFDAHIMHWEYITAADLDSSIFMDSYFKLEHDTPHIGDYATTSIYIEII